MEYSQLIQKRYSVRAYCPDPVPQVALQRILEAARLAPTAANRQPFGLVVANLQERQAEMAALYHRPWFLQAPMLILACAIPARAWVHPSGKSYVDVDVAIVMDHLVLAATNEGLGTCWIAHFDFEAARRLFALPEDVQPVAFTPLGYPADAPRRKERRSLEELIHTERW